LAGVFAKDDSSLPGYLWWQHESHRAIRAGDWKLVALKGGEWELYDLSKDRGESNNLASALPERVGELSTLWEKQSLENIRLAQGDRPARPGEAGRKKGGGF
jgi:arylsulfatase